MRIHFEKNGEQFEGEINEDIYYLKIFSIFRDHLIPITEKKFYTLEEAESKIKLKQEIQPKKRWGLF